MIAILSSLRPHQWLKNLLLFVPFVSAHEKFSPENIATLLLAFSSFSLCASAVYILNDLLDLESDRKHRKKKNRPFASGKLRPVCGVIAIPFLLFFAYVSGVLIGERYLICLSFYLISTTIYSLVLKKIAIFDCITLALLYTLRIISGANAVMVSLSFWLLAFSIFIFLSLAFLKRYAELKNNTKSGETKVSGRSYFVTDAAMIQTLGITSGYMSTLIFALYLQNPTVVQLYERPEYIWGAIPFLLFWISWAWLKAHRGEMDEDPVVFAVKDKTSLFVGALFATFFVIAAV